MLIALEHKNSKILLRSVMQQCCGKVLFVNIILLSLVTFVLPPAGFRPVKVFQLVLWKLWSDFICIGFVRPGREIRRAERGISQKDWPHQATKSPFSATKSPFLATKSPFSSTMLLFRAIKSPFLATKQPFLAIKWPSRHQCCRSGNKVMWTGLKKREENGGGDKGRKEEGIRRVGEVGSPL